MTLAMPSKQDCYYVLKMLQTSLIDFTYTHPWAEDLILGADPPPIWLCDLATLKNQGDQINAVQEFVLSEPFESAPADLEKFAVACYWLRYERRELSWATFLQMAGEVLDSADSDWACEVPYRCLSDFQAAYFSQEAEERTKQQFLQAYDLNSWINTAEARLEPFLCPRKNRT